MCGFFVYMCGCFPGLGLVEALKLLPSAPCDQLEELRVKLGKNENNNVFYDSGNQSN